MDASPRNPRVISVQAYLRGRAMKSIVIGLPLAVLMSGNVGAASRTVSWNAVGPQTAADQAWLDSLTGPVASVAGGSPLASVGPDTPVLPAGGDPHSLVLTQPPAQDAVGTPSDALLPSQLNVAAAPLIGDTSVTAQLAASGIPVRALKAYVAAADLTATRDPKCHLHWSLLAGIGRVESNHGRFGGAGIAVDGVVSPPIYGPGWTEPAGWH